MISTVECYDADAPDGRAEPPVRRWRQEVWSAECGGAAQPPRPAHAGRAERGLLHPLGAVVGAGRGYRPPALGIPLPGGGEPPRRRAAARPGPVARTVQGRVYAAPADADRILCLDARGGELVWEQSANVVQLLGVAQGRLFATLGGFPRGVSAFDAGRGTVLWTRPDAGDLPTFGRGLLSDRFLFWPTRLGLRVLRQDSGEAEYVGSGSEPWGNLALGDGWLVVTTPMEIWGFAPPCSELGRLRQAAADHPESAEDQYRVVLAEADAGEAEQRWPASVEWKNSARAGAPEGWRCRSCATPAFRAARSGPGRLWVAHWQREGWTCCATCPPSRSRRPTACGPGPCAARRRPHAARGAGVARPVGGAPRWATGAGRCVSAESAR